MPTFHLRRAALCAALLAIVPCGSIAHAQTAPPPPLPPAPAVVPPAPPLPPPDLNLALLQKALAPLVNSHVADSESEMQVYASKKGAIFTLREHFKITARRPGRFVSEVTLREAPGAPATLYRVSSNGLKVTTYCPSTGRYAVLPLAQFQAGDDDFPSLGLVIGLLYLGDTSFIKSLNKISKDGTGESLVQMRKLGMALTSKPMTVDGTPYTTFGLQIGKQGEYRFYVDPRTESMAMVELRTMQDGVTIRMLEKIAFFNPLLSVPPDTFQAAVPSEAQKVKELSVGFF